MRYPELSVYGPYTSTAASAETVAAAATAVTTVSTLYSHH
jgi:hypothetical protein